MYEDAAILAAVVLLYSAAAGRIGRSWLSGPILFTAAGLILGPAGIDALRLPLTATVLRTLAEFALAMVLFTDAAHADLSCRATHRRAARAAAADRPAADHRARLPDRAVRLPAPRPV